MYIDRTTRWEQLPDLMSIKEVAQYTGVSYSTIRKAVLSGKLPCKEIGQRLYVEKDFFMQNNVTLQKKWIPGVPVRKQPVILTVTPREDSKDETSSS